jgi:putative nucleotidyltransferase with HDIG domain
MSEQFKNILQGFAGIIKNLAFYPPDHPSIKRQSQTLTEQLMNQLSDKQEIMFGIAEDILFFGDVQFYEMPPALEELKSRLENKEVLGIIFSQNMEDWELAQLLLALSLTEDKLPAGGVSEYLTQNKVSHIYLDEVELDIDERARQVYSDAKNTVSSIMSEARMGKVPRADKAIGVVRGMQEIILADPNALLGLTMLSDYDNYTFNHSVNVGVLSSTLSTAIGFEEQITAQIGLAALLHDIGKTNTPIEIINKPGKLSPEEWAAIKQHPTDGAKIISQMKGVGEVAAKIVLEHHAKYDLTGYPSFNKGYVLNRGSLVVAIADTYDSMTTLRPYQKRFDPKEAIAIMLKMKGTAFFPEYLETFIKILGIYPVGTLVRLDSGEIGLVNGVSQDFPDRPKLKVIFDSLGSNLGDNYFEIDLANQEPNAPEKTIIATLDPMSKNIDLAQYN